MKHQLADASSSAVLLLRTHLMKLNSYLNSIYRKLFGYFKCEFVKDIYMFCQRLDFVHVVDKGIGITEV